jgi:hypothetical protein
MKRKPLLVPWPDQRPTDPVLQALADTIGESYGVLGHSFWWHVRNTDYVLLSDTHNQPRPPTASKKRGLILTPRYISRDATDPTRTVK